MAFAGVLSQIKLLFGPLVMLPNGRTIWNMLAVVQLPYETLALIFEILLKGHGHDTDDWRDYDEDNVPFERLEKVYVPDGNSLKQRINIFHGQLYSLHRDNGKFRLPLQLFFW